MTESRHARPWYCRDRVVDEYHTTLTEDGERLPMLKTIKIIRSIIVNLGIIGLGILAISRGGDPTLLGGLAVATLGLYNGLELGDYLALVQAYKEVQSQQDE